MSKQHKNMDRTSASIAAWLDKKREEAKKQAPRRKGQLRYNKDKGSLSRGGFR